MQEESLFNMRKKGVGDVMFIIEFKSISKSLNTFKGWFSCFIEYAHETVSLGMNRHSNKFRSHIFEKFTKSNKW